MRFYSFVGFASASVYDRNDQKVSEPENLRSEIFEAWMKRDELALFEFLQKPVFIPESVVTPLEKLAQNKGSSVLDLVLERKTEFVTPETIKIVKTSGVTTNSTIETPIESD